MRSLQDSQQEEDFDDGARIDVGDTEHLIQVEPDEDGPGEAGGRSGEGRDDQEEVA